MDFISVKNELSKPHWNLSEVARGSGVSYPTLTRLLNVEGQKPLEETVKKLSDYIYRIHYQRQNAIEKLDDPRYADAAREVIDAIDKEVNDE